MFCKGEGVVAYLKNEALDCSPQTGLIRSRGLYTMSRGVAMAERSFIVFKLFIHLMLR